MHTYLCAGRYGDLRFEISMLGARLPPVSGVYAVMSSTSLGWRLWYIGKAEDLDERIGLGLRAHHHEPDFDRVGATHIAAVSVANMFAVDAIEKELIGHYCPPLNDTHNPIARPAYGAEARSILGDLFR